MLNLHRHKRWARFAVASIALVGLAACTGEPVTPPPAPVQYAPEDLETTGAIGVKLPDGYTVVDAEGYKYGWPWAAIKHDDNGDITGLIVMNGNYENTEGTEEILWGMQSWQVAATENYTKSEITALSKDGADDAVFQDYSYSTDVGRTNFGTYVALCSDEHHSCALARTTFVGTPEHQTQTDLVNSITFTPENAADQPPLAELLDQ